MAGSDPSSLERAVRYSFKSPALLEQCLTHKSHAIERGSPLHNERLEFLGDSVLAAVTAHYLFKRHPEDDEGRLSKMKSQLVSRPSLVGWAKEIGLGRHLRLSPGEEASGGRERDSLLANAFEALLGAIFLDSGFAAAQRVVLRHLSRQPDLEETDYKSNLQEIIQKRYKSPPSYLLDEERGPDHHKAFVMRVQVRGRVLGRGEGRSKKEAEQAAARAALSLIRRHRLSTVIDPTHRSEPRRVPVRRRTGADILYDTARRSIPPPEGKETP